MSINYHIYANNGAGGPIDWTTIVATVSALTWTSSTLALSSDTTYGIRAFDTSTGYEEQSIDATARILLDGSGNDITLIPDPPGQLSVTVGAAGSATVQWTWFGEIPPTGFKIYSGTPTISYGAPALIIPYGPGRSNFRATLTGLTGGSTYQIGVRAYGATGEEKNTTIFPIVADTTPPTIVDNFTVTVIA